MKTKKFYPWNYSTEYKSKDLVCHLATPMGIRIQPPSVNDPPLPPHLKITDGDLYPFQIQLWPSYFEPWPPVWSGHWNSTFTVFLGDQLALWKVLWPRAASVGSPPSPLAPFWGAGRWRRSSREGNDNPLQYSAWKVPWTEEPGYSPWGRKELDMTEQLNQHHHHNRRVPGKRKEEFSDRQRKMGKWL